VDGRVTVTNQGYQGLRLDEFPPFWAGVQVMETADSKDIPIGSVAMLPAGPSAGAVKG